MFKNHTLKRKCSCGKALQKNQYASKINVNKASCLAVIKSNDFQLIFKIPCRLHCYFLIMIIL